MPNHGAYVHRELEVRYEKMRFFRRANRAPMPYVQSRELFLPHCKAIGAEWAAGDRDVFYLSSQGLSAPQLLRPQTIYVTDGDRSRSNNHAFLLTLS